MNRQTKISAFALDRPLPREMYGEGMRPTAVVMLQTAQHELILVRLHEALDESDGNDYICPQGLISREETPRAATVRIVGEECGISKDDIQAMQAFNTAVKSDHHNTRENICLLVFATLFPHVPLRHKVQRTAKSMILVGGPNHLWNKIQDARPERRQFMIRATVAAVQQGLLSSHRWQRERVLPMLQYGAQ